MADEQTQRRSDAIVAAGPPSATDTIEQPIGVPIGYAARPEYVPGVTPPFALDAQQPARYFEGADWQPAAWSPEKVASLQREMEAAGLIPAGTQYRLGVWDDTSRAAYRDLLGYANATGLIVPQALRRYAMGQQAAKPADPYLRPDPDAIRQDIRTVFRSKLGREVDEGELLTLVNEYLAVDRQAYDTVQTAISSGQQTVQQVDPAARFNEQFERRYKPEMQRIDGVQAGQKMRELLLGNVTKTDSLIA